MIGILLIWRICGTIYFDGIRDAAGGISNQFLLNLSVILIFCGAIGKSAQVPLACLVARCDGGSHSRFAH